MTTKAEVSVEEQSVQGETMEQIAERISDNYVPYCSDWRDRKRMEVDILSALRNQTQRCAEIAETCHPQPCVCQTCLIRAEAGAAIRKLLKPSGKEAVSKSKLRYRCSVCRKRVATYVPRGGDGSAIFFKRRKDRAGRDCKGGGAEATRDHGEVVPL